MHPQSRLQSKGANMWSKQLPLHPSAHQSAAASHRCYSISRLPQLVLWQDGPFVPGSASLCCGAQLKIGDPLPHFSSYCILSSQWVESMDIFDNWVECVCQADGMTHPQNICHIDLICCCISHQAPSLQQPIPLKALKQFVMLFAVWLIGKGWALKRVSSQKGGGEFSCMNSIKGDSEIRIHVDGSPHICGQADTGNILQGCLGLLLFFQIPPLHHGFNSLPWWKGDVRSSLATRAQKPWSDTTVKGWQSFTLNSTGVSSSSCFLLPKI